MNEQQVNLNVESKERIPLTRVGVELVKAGGLGDILHMAKLVNNLSAREGVQVDVYSSGVTDRYLDICRGEFGDASILGTVESAQLEPDILITHTVPKTKRKGKSARIHIEEFSYQEGSEVQEADYVVGTGLGFNPAEVDKIQSGITDSLTLKRKLEQRESIKQKTRGRLGKLLEKAGIRDKVSIKEARIGLLYTSSLSTNFSYIEELSKVVEQLDEPIVIFCIGSSPKGYRVGAFENEPIGKKLRALLGKASVSFYDIEDEDALRYDRGEESNVTFVNLGRSIDHDFFQDLLLSVDFPSVVTGDQSLAEAIQVTSSTNETPPFLYYCYFGEKSRDFIERMRQESPEAAAIVADYILREDVPEHSRSILPTLREVRDQMEGVSLRGIFTDVELQRKYTKAMAMIPENIRKAKAQHIPMAEKLVWESDTIDFIVSCLRKREEEKIRLLKPARQE